MLRPGDALYLPRGWLHSAEALGETTIHLTVGMHATTRYDLLQALVALAADSPALRESLPIGAATADPARAAGRARPHGQGAADRLAAATAATRPTPYAAGPTAPPGRSPSAPLAQLDAINGLTADTRIRLRRHAQARVEERRPTASAVSAADQRRRGQPPGIGPAGAGRAAGRRGLTGSATCPTPTTGPTTTSALARTLLTEGLVVPA